MQLPAGPTRNIFTLHVLRCKERFMTRPPNKDAARPGAFPLGSLESRAAARAMLRCGSMTLATSPLRPPGLTVCSSWEGVSTIRNVLKHRNPALFGRLAYDFGKSGLRWVDGGVAGPGITSQRETAQLILCSMSGGCKKRAFFGPEWHFRINWFGTARGLHGLAYE